MMDEAYQRQREYDECIDMMHLYGLGGMDLYGHDLGLDLDDWDY